MKPSSGQVLDPAETAFFADLQALLSRKRLSLSGSVSRICGVDAAYRGDRVVAVACLLDRGKLKETSFYFGTCSIKYQSGLFYLREGPFAVEAVRRLRVRPELVCFDAHGAAHPRFAGLATMCGMILGIPSIGCAKSLLVGSVEAGGVRFDRIVQQGKTLGFVARSTGGTRYWSPGYGVSLRWLEPFLRGYAPICLKALSEADRVARTQIRTG